MSDSAKEATVVLAHHPCEVPALAHAVRVPLPAGFDPVLLVGLFEVDVDVHLPLIDGVWDSPFIRLLKPRENPTPTQVTVIL